MLHDLFEATALSYSDTLGNELNRWMHTQACTQGNPWRILKAAHTHRNCDGYPVVNGYGSDLGNEYCHIVEGDVGIDAAQDPLLVVVAICTKPH